MADETLFFGVDVIVDIDSYYFRATGQGQDSSPDGHWVLRFHKRMDSLLLLPLYVVDDFPWKRIRLMFLFIYL